MINATLTSFSWWRVLYRHWGDGILKGVCSNATRLTHCKASRIWFVNWYLSVIVSCLKDRRRHVKIMGEHSDWTTVNRGVHLICFLMACFVWKWIVELIIILIITIFVMLTIVIWPQKHSRRWYKLCHRLVHQRLYGCISPFQVLSWAESGLYRSHYLNFIVPTDMIKE